MKAFSQTYLGLLGILLLFIGIIKLLPWDYQHVYLIYTSGFFSLFTLQSLIRKKIRFWRLSSSALLAFAGFSALIGLFLHYFPFSPIAHLSGDEFLGLTCIALLILGILQTYKYVKSKEVKDHRKFTLPFLLSLLILHLNGFPLSYHFQAYSSVPEIGTKPYHFVDETRKESLTNDPDDVRELMVQFSYPAITFSKQEPIPYKLSRRIWTNSYLDARISSLKEKYPLIIYSSGAGATRFDNTHQIEALVSDNYVVAAIDHTFFNTVQFPDGRIIKANSMDISRKEYSLEAYMQEIELETRVVDIQRVLDEITRMNNDSTSFLYQKVDLDKVGVFGWSIGGAAAGKTCTIDKRFKAGLNLDGWDWMKWSDTLAYTAPFMYIQSDRNEIGWKELRIAGMSRSSFEEREAIQQKYEEQLFTYNKQDIYKVILKGSMHSNLRDHGILGLGQLGSGDAERISSLNSRYIVRFFGNYLQNYSHPVYDAEYGAEGVQFYKNGMSFP